MVNERGCKLKTAENNIKMLRQFFLFLERDYAMEAFDPVEIKPKHIRRYLGYLKNELGNSPKTRNHKIDAIRSYYFFLGCYEYIEECEDPTLLIRRARVSRRLPFHLTLEEAEALLSVAAAGTQPERDIAILRVMMQTGVRVGELIRLRVQDLDFRERTLFIKGKGNRERLVALTKNTCSALKLYLEVRLPASSQIDTLFLNQLNMPLRQGVLYLLFHQLCREAGVQKPRLSACHLRHTCLTLLFQQGVDLMALKKLAAHKSVRTTQVYLRVSQTQLREAMKKHPLG